MSKDRICKCATSDQLRQRPASPNSLRLSWPQQRASPHFPEGCSNLGDRPHSRPGPTLSRREPIDGAIPRGAFKCLKLVSKADRTRSQGGTTRSL
ncbi:hypothetical protein VUR80DRAFT_1430 [Thermomyces stellatus]